MAQRIRSDFDCDAYVLSGGIPWTFFAYPSRGNTEPVLPLDDEACEMFSKLQALGIPLTLWRHPGNETTYFACRGTDRQALYAALATLEQSGQIEPDFCRIHSERLFASNE